MQLKPVHCIRHKRMSGSCKNMEISNFRIPDPVVNSIGAALEVTGEVGFEKILFTAAGQDGSADRVN